ncbi:hypothetical protein FKG94_10240 [Exilibacterium tricleocarpae]|uniref:IPT/TIG domain-containing protein n=1 Tax=Exilibacterium tricleocarpae TaxID=2591008 RepID=A0A545TS54_9GAMM|nr:hypothetical protein [Exilibacterium tricleocarpae]TQV80043.1 hypothetical protein FKG94_10240 [Exilibacterium tricleocarpae]
MKGKLRGCLVAGALSFAFFAHAETSNWHQVEKLIIGSNGAHGTLVFLSGSNFNGCPVNQSALVDNTNPNYSSIPSVLLAARLADKPVRVTYSGCTGDYARVLEVQI